MFPLKTYVLKDWKFRESKAEKEDDDWYPSHDPTAETTEIFTDLLANNVIDHPFKNDNEQQVQWVGLKDWEYSSTFEIVPNTGKKQLVFEGLDTFADIYLNEKLLITTDNQFREYVVDLQDCDIRKGSNTLRIVFHSALKYAKKTFQPKSLLPLDESRMFVRKAQYNYGWDWGPILMTSGIYKPVKYLSFETTRLNDVYVSYEVVDTAESLVEFSISTQITCEFEGLTIEHEIASLETGEVVYSMKDSLSGLISSSEKVSIKVDLWYPFTHGDPKRYHLTTRLVYEGSLIDTKCQHVGFRKVDLIQEPLQSEPGTSFYFKINDTPTYLNGTNWIPASSFPTSVTKLDYTNWLSLQKNAHQNMLRIWGGGLYESDNLYDEADRLGILVWQDFLFACGQYPGDENFINNVKEEAYHQIHRLRAHPSLVIYAGNNEDYQTIEEYNIPDDEFYAKDIYEKVLPDLVKSHHPSAKYICGSPWSPGGKSASDLTVGDVHQWNVWHGDERPYQEWPKLVGRFVSEFGMLALPNIKTYKETIDDPTELYPQSRLIELHNKAAGFEKKLTFYVFQNLKLKSLCLDDWIYATQLIQAESHTFALQSFRRRWGTVGDRLTGGQLVWQLNDTYPVASWALVDHYQRPKLGYYAIKRESSPIVLGSKRNEESIELDERQKDTALYNLLPKRFFIDVWVSNATQNEHAARLDVTLYKISSNIAIETRSFDVVVKSNSSTELLDKALYLKDGVGEDVVALFELRDKRTGSIISSTSNWPQPLKYLKFPKGAAVQYAVKDGYIELYTDYPIKAVSIDTEDDVIFDDNGFDLFPGRPKTVTGRVREGQKISLRFYQ